MVIRNMVNSMNIDYDKIQKSINEYGKYILSCIKNECSNSLTSQQLQTINHLLNTEFIMIERPSNADIEFFSRQDGIENPNDYSIDYIPSAHGGRTKNDNKIHIYPYTKSFSECKTDDEIIKSCVENIVVHEIFHYFIRPNLSLESETIKDEFGHFLTEGLVQYYTEVFMEKHRLGSPKSNYGKNVEFAKKLISSFPSNLSQTQIDRIIFTYNQDELLKVSQNGKELYEEFSNDLQFQKDISAYITDLCLNIGLKEEGIKSIVRHYSKISDLNTIFDELSKNVEIILKDNKEMQDSYMLKLRNLISDRKLKIEMNRYEIQMKSFLPTEEQVNKLRRNGMSLEDIKTTLGSDSYIFDYVPNVLYHGSPENLDIINPNESTQKGSYVYATDNPVHALFFSIFRNSSVARAHIDEYIDEHGNYKVKYQIDERIKGALDEIITDRYITIHVCDGKQFFKPQGAAYIGREWISKDNQSIVPIDKIQINVKHFFENLEKQGLVEYDRYDKPKDWKTVIDMLGQNYPFGLGTDRGKNMQEYDLMYDEFIKTNFPLQLEFSKQFREFVKRIMATDYKLENLGMTLEDENNYKLKYIKDIADSFLIAKRDKNGKINWDVDIDKINAFMNPTETMQEEQGRNL